MKSTLAPRTCRQCGREFLGGPRAWYCPECRQERRRQQAKKFKAKRQADRSLGSIDRCVVCGKEYTVNSARQKYCPVCAYDAFRAVDRVQGRGNLKRSIDKYGPEYAKQVKAKKLAARRQAKRPKVCKICGREFIPDVSRRFYCSDLCRKMAQDFIFAVSRHRRGLLKRQPIRADYMPGGRFFEKNRARFAGPFPVSGAVPGLIT